MRAHYSASLAGARIADPTLLTPLSAASAFLYEEGTNDLIGETIYAAASGGTTQPNPIPVNADGSIAFFLARPKRLDIVTMLAGFQSKRVTVNVSRPDLSNAASVFEYMTGAQIADVTGGLGLVDVTAAVQAYIDSFPAVDNRSPPVEVGAGDVPLPAGKYLVSAPSRVPAGMRLIGAGPDATRFVVPANYNGNILEFKQYDVPSSRLRRGGAESLSIYGGGSTNSIGIYCSDVAEMLFRRLHVSTCGTGMSFSEVTTAKIAECKVGECQNYGIRAIGQCNGFTVDGCRLWATKHGANLSVDGPQAYTWNVIGCAIESAGVNTPASGHGIWVGPTNYVVGFNVAHCHFEANRASHIKYGGGDPNNRSIGVLTGNTYNGSNLTPDGILLDGARVIIQGGYASAHTTAAINITPNSAGCENHGLVIGSGTKLAGAGRLVLDLDPNVEIRSDASVSVNGTNGAKFTSWQGPLQLVSASQRIPVTGALNGNYMGFVTLSGGTAAVTFTPAMGDTVYQVLLGGDANETFYITNRTSAGFTINSSNPSSTARVAWMAVR